MKLWPHVDRKHPCPICGKPDWCQVSPDGVMVACRRVTEGCIKHGDGSPMTLPAGGAVFRLMQAMAIPPHIPKKQDTVPSHQLWQMWQWQRRRPSPEAVRMFAQSLGLNQSMLWRIGLGQHEDGNWTFPMFDVRHRLIGIRIRGHSGKKWAVPGSKNGLFLARERLYDPIVVCEGPTDTAAAMTCGFSAVGRPMCSGLHDLVEGVIAGRHVIIVSDNDPPKTRPDGSTWKPGQEGANRLAEAIWPVCQRLQLYTPPNHKDLREMLGAESKLFIRSALQLAGDFNGTQA